MIDTIEIFKKLFKESFPNKIPEEDNSIHYVIRNLYIFDFISV